MKLLTLIASLVIAIAPPALGQGVAPHGVIVGDGRDFRQDLTRPGAAPQAGTPRQERQRQINRNYPGTGRPVAAAPAAVTPPAPPSAPARPQPQLATAAPRVTPAVPQPSTRAAPVNIQPGQSTGAARGTPASR